MRWSLFLAFVVLLATTGCDNSLWKKAAEPAPAGPTKAEVLAKVKPIIEPFRQLADAPAGPGSPGLANETRDQVISALRDAELQYGSTPAGQEALKDVGHDIVDIAKHARDQERWKLVEACVDAYEILNMESVSLTRLDERAKLMLARPKIEMKGFIDDKEKNATYVFLRLTDRKTGKMKTVTQREGDEFDDLRLVGIIGNNKAVRLEYMKIPGLVFEVEGPKF